MLLKLAALEDLLDLEKPPLERVEALGPPAQLDLVFRLALLSFIKRGPEGSNLGSGGPARMLALAQRAAAKGIIWVKTLVHLRPTLLDLESQLRDQGFWHSDQPLWWAPLPEADRLEELWLQLERKIDPLQSSKNLFSDEYQPWICWPAWLEPGFRFELWNELEASSQHGALQLERAGVGAAARLSHHRSDEVGYFTGLEQAMLEALPHLAVLVQWCLLRFGPCLRESMPNRDLVSPQTAMLARYPAPSGGYAPHVDNPGGNHDNGRCLTFICYLNQTACSGGELAIWGPRDDLKNPPAEVLTASDGNAVVFDARAVTHQVRPLDEGVARWALTLWFNDSAPPELETAGPIPALNVTDAMAPIAQPSLPPGKVLFHEFSPGKTPGVMTSRNLGAQKPRVGLVCTVYRGGTALDAWCAHHLGMGMDHIILVFDHLEEAGETAHAKRLTTQYPPERLTIWDGSEVAAERWPTFTQTGLLADLLPFARSGSSPWAVASRQALNATAALHAAKQEIFAGKTLDWLVHLDADEWFYLEGPARGGKTLHQHFSAAAEAGFGRIRYLNHELLLPPGQPARFKRNPRVAAARLGTAGWPKLVSQLAMAQTDTRPYFFGYINGKSAVSVQAGLAAAGVHGWTLSASSQAGDAELAGPSVLHFHSPSREVFQRKCLARAATPPPKKALFHLSSTENTAFDIIRTLSRSGADRKTMARRLDELYLRATTFTRAELALLGEAGLLFEPKLAHPLLDCS